MGPAPDPPRPGRSSGGWLRHLVGAANGSDDHVQMTTEELVSYRVRRGAVQALVREAYQAVIAEQDGAHRPPAAFAQAWRARLAMLLDQAVVDVDGWGLISIADLDMDLVWSLFEAASEARQRTIEHAIATRSRRVQRGQDVPTFEFEVTGDGESLGEVIYGICEPCRVGLLYKIEFPPHWQFCGLGRLALNQLETWHPDLMWYTTGQFKHARGFYERYRQDSSGLWTSNQHPCAHFR
jgi:hypothetical protein